MEEIEQMKLAQQRLLSYVDDCDSKYERRKERMLNALDDFYSQLRVLENTFENRPAIASQSKASSIFMKDMMHLKEVVQEICMLSQRLGSAQKATVIAEDVQAIISAFSQMEECRAIGGSETGERYLPNNRSDLQLEDLSALQERPQLSYSASAIRPRRYEVPNIVNFLAPYLILVGGFIFLFYMLSETEYLRSGHRPSLLGSLFSIRNSDLPPV